MESEEISVGALECPDCGAKSSGTYCPKCGEEMEPRLPTVKHYLHELLHEFAELDSKLVRTIPALFRPGFLTKEYLAGRRQRYLKPSRLYLLVAVVFFVLLGSSLKERIMSPVKSQVIQFSIKGSAANIALEKHYGEVALGHLSVVAPYVILLGSTPLFTLILFFLYRRKKLFAEHLIFSYHVVAFAIIAFAPSLLLDSGDIGGLSQIAFFVYLYMALRRVYADRGVGLALRFVASAFAYEGLLALAVYLSLMGCIWFAQITGEIPKGAEIFM